VNRFSSLPLVAILLAGSWGSTASAQAGEGAKFAARDPRTCPDHIAPKRGAITPELAARYVTCEEEHASASTLYLVDSMKVQIGAGRKFQLLTDSYDEIDSGKPVYPIRGSYVRYSCSVPREMFGTVGKNCTLYDQPHASGVCYKTTFGDWHCSMKDLDHTLTTLRTAIPPPR
jgi:hypothetical protein